MESEEILVVDDDKEIADLVEVHLVSEGYTVLRANTAKEGIRILKTAEIKLVILELMIPGEDGLTMCKKIREMSAIPIIILSTKSSDLDKIIGLGAGADDYVIKPFSPLELMARVKSQLRRYTKFNPYSRNKRQEREIVLENLTILKENHKVSAYGRDVKLTPIEFDILYLLASNVGRVFSTEEIFERVWNEKMYEANNTVMVHIRRIREKIDLESCKSQIIKTVWGVGYKIEK